MATTAYTSQTIDNPSGQGQTTVYTPIAPAQQPTSIGSINVPSVTPAAVAPPAPVKAINSSYTAPTAAPAPLPPTTAPTAAQNALGSSVTAYGANMQSYADIMKNAQTGGAETTPAGGSLKDILGSILTLNTKLGTKGDETKRINAEAGIDEKTQKVQQLTNEYNSRGRYYDDLIKAVQTKNVEGKSADAIQQQVDELTRQKSSELADIAIQHSAATGDLSTAQTLAKQKIDAEFEPVQSQIDNLKTYYSLASNDMTESEKMQAQAAIQDKQSQLDEAKQMRLADYQEKIKQSDPLYRAQVASERALAAQRSAAAGGGADGYNGNFAATIDLAANTGGTNQQRAAIKKTLQSLIAAGDYQSAYAAIQQAATQGLKGQAQKDFQDRTNQLAVTQALNAALLKLKNAGYNTNKLTGSANAVQNKVGALLTDPKYAAAAVELNAALQSYRLQMTGANFSAKEASDYASVLPNAGNTFALNQTKIQGLTDFLNATVDGYTSQVVGAGGKCIRQYAQGAAPSAPQPTQTDAQGRLTGGKTSSGLGFTITY